MHINRDLKEKRTASTNLPQNCVLSHNLHSEEFDKKMDKETG